MLLRARLINPLNLSRSKFKSHSTEIITQPLFLAAGSQDHNVLVNAPTQENLTGTDGVFLGQAGQEVVEGPGGAF